MDSAARNKKLVSWVLSAFFLIGSPAFAGTVTIATGWPESGSTSQQAIDGGTDEQTLATTSSTSSVSEVVSEITSSSATTTDQSTEDGSGGGVGVVFSKHVKVYKVPVSYTVNKTWKVGATIPYVEKNLKGNFGGEDLKDSGLGDISLNVKHTSQKEIYRLVSSIYLKLPTGNHKQFKNGKERLALGTGSYDWIWSESIVVKSAKYENIRWLGGFSFNYNGSSNYSEKATIANVTGSFTFNNKQGNSLSLFGGALYFTKIPKLMTYGNLSFLMIWPGHEEYRESTGALSVNRELNNSLMAWDAIPGLKYQFSKKSAVRLGAIIPVATSYDKDVTDKKARQVMVDFGVDYVF